MRLMILTELYQKKFLPLRLCSGLYVPYDGDRYDGGNHDKHTSGKERILLDELDQGFSDPEKVCLSELKSHDDNPP